MAEKKLTPQERARQMAERMKAGQGSLPKDSEPEVRPVFRDRGISDGPFAEGKRGESAAEKSGGELWKGQVGDLKPSDSVSVTPRDKQAPFTNEEIEKVVDALISSSWNLIAQDYKVIAVVFKTGDLRVTCDPETTGIGVKSVEERLRDLENHIDEIEKILPLEPEVQEVIKQRLREIVLSGLGSSAEQMERKLGQNSLFVRDIVRDKILDDIIQRLDDYLRPINSEVISAIGDPSVEEINDVVGKELDHIRSLMHMFHKATPDEIPKTMRDLSDLVRETFFNFTLLTMPEDRLDELFPRAYAIIVKFNEADGRPKDRQILHNPDPRVEIKTALAISSLVATGSSITDLSRIDVDIEARGLLFNQLENAVGKVDYRIPSQDLVDKLLYALEMTLPKPSTR